MDDRSLEENNREEEELIDLDFEFEELSDEYLEEPGEGSSSGTNVIELVDVVEEGRVSADPGTDEISGLQMEAGAEGTDAAITEPVPDEVQAGLDTMMEGFDTSEVDFGPMSEQAESAPSAEDQPGGASGEDVDRELELELDAALEGFDTSQLETGESQDGGEDAIPDEIAKLLDEAAMGGEEAVEQGAESEPMDLEDLPEVDIPEGLEAELQGLDMGEEETGADLSEGELQAPFEDLEDQVPSVEMEPEEDRLEFEEVPVEVAAEPEADLDPAFSEEEQVVSGEREASEEPEVQDQDLSQAPDSEAEAAPAIGMVPPLQGQDVTISEERLEAMITKVVQESVERAARETMSQIAEKFITSAIEALKKSLEDDSGR